MAVSTAYEVELLTTQYSTALELLLQQKDTRLRSYVRTGSHVGKMASPIQYAGSLQFKQVAARGSPLQPQLNQYQRRWVFPNDKDLTIQVDTFDELRTIIDPRSAISAQIMAAANRLFDDVIIQGFFGPASIGVDSSSLTTETFNSGSDFPIGVVIADTFGAGAATGLSVKKLIEARRILRRYEWDLDGMMPCIAIGAQQEADLLNQLEVVSSEYNRDYVLKDGRIESFLGFHVLHSERLLTTGSDRRLPVWVMDDMYLGLWKDMQTIISQRNDLVGHPWQAYSMISLGASRLQGGGIIEIDCLDASVGTSSQNDISL